MTGPASYVFLSWVRAGLARLPRSDETTSRATVSVALQVAKGASRTATAVANVEQKVQLYGPGDVIGLDLRQMIRTEPSTLSTDFEANYFPAVEFDPGLPWLLTPDPSPTAAEKHRLRPWLVLVVVRQSRGTFDDKRRPLPVLAVKDAAAELPDLSESWAWAHAQVATAGQAPGEALNEAPDLTLGRLLCPRRLEARTAYHACVVPAFKAGLEAGLGKDVTAAAEPAWQQPPPDGIELPVYYHWEFTTADGGDFKSLAQRLRPRRLPRRVGVRPADANGAGPELPTGLPPLPLEGALRPVAPDPSSEPPPEPWPEDVRKLFATKLEPLLEARPGAHELALPPPIYGDGHAGSPGEIPAPGRPWLSNLNLDPRYRVAAALGAAVVQGEQEQLMASAWDQAGELEHANQILRYAELAVSIEERLYQKRLQPLAPSPEPESKDTGYPDVALLLTAPAHARVQEGNETLRSRVVGSVFPEAAASPQFRRAVRPTGPLGRRMSGSVRARRAAAAPLPDLLDQLGRGAIELPHVEQPPGMVSVDAATAKAVEQDQKYADIQYDAATGAALEHKGWRRLVDFRPEGLAVVTQAATLQPRQPGEGDIDTGAKEREYLENDETKKEKREELAYIRARFRAASLKHQAHLGVGQPALTAFDDRPKLPLPEVAASLVRGPEASLGPRRTIAAHVAPRISGGAPQLLGASAGVEPLAPTPVFPQPMYAPLLALSQQLLVPGVEQVPADCVALLEANPQFIEAYMVGLNHEFARELLWRGYPTDPTATFFRQFWDARGRLPGGGAGPATDIEPIADWKRPLGENATAVGGAGMLVLLVRGELVRRHPNLTLYAVKAKDRRTLTDPEDVWPAAFRAKLDPDLLLIGFELTVDRVRWSETDAGYFFVFQQHPTAPRFGFDTVPTDAQGAPVYGGNPRGWSDLSWGHFAADAASFAKLTHAAALKTFTLSEPDPSVTWGENAAHVARIALRPATRVAIHGEDLVGPTAPNAA